MLIINRIFIMVIMLSISGFIFSAVFLIFEKLSYKFTSAKFMVLINSAALFTFVIPFYFAYYLIDETEKSCLLGYKPVVFTDGSMTDRIITKIHLIFDFVINYIDIIWLLFSVIFILINIVNYFRLIKNIKNNSFYIENKIWTEKFEELKKENKTDKILLVESKSIGVPCTVGLTNKYIIIPDFMINMFDEKEAELILKHEFFHALRKDAPRKALIIILNCLNWFNPLFYFLNNNLSNWIESACDEEVIKGLSYDDRKKYAELIIKVLEAEKSYNIKKKYYVACFNGSSVKNYKKRILRIIKSKKNKVGFGKILVLSFAFVSVFASSVIAKDADAIVNKVFSNGVTLLSKNNSEFISFEEYENEMQNLIDFNTIDFDVGDYSEFEIEDNNKEYEIIYSDKTISNDFYIKTTTEHTHQTVNVVLSEQGKYNNGSSNTAYYKGKICTICNKVWCGEKIKTVTENKPEK